MNRYICIHGHFYQPPRENPWLEEIELQDSAYPYRDWNDRITAECYAPNAASRILDGKENIVNIVNNYARISFNFGATLLSWMKQCRPLVYQKLLEADRESQKLFSGHGAAIAQAYNHMILPLANGRDKRTQVIWGIKDFEFHFKRRPEGMWLPETAVDVPTLDVLAEAGIRFTILAPSQARRFRRIGEKNWQDVRKGGLDPQRPYLCRLPSGREIVLFFYDGPISHDVAFGGLLNNGEAFAQRLTSVFPQGDDEARLVHIATDGETYGHHHRFGNMALSYGLHLIESQQLAQLTIYGEFLEKNPPQYEVEVVENSSWSCSHGIERWRANCGCCIGNHPGWHQKWRGPLREAMDGLRDKGLVIYEKGMAAFAKDPWLVRDEYIQVVLDRSPENIEGFIKRHARKDLTKEDKVTFLKLLEMQRHAMLMYTSCGWFFDDISGIETVQIISYAARVIQLAKEISGKNLEQDFVKRLESAPSNVPDQKNGAEIYRATVQPDVTDLLNVGAHYAMSSLFEEYPKTVQIYCYAVYFTAYEHYESGKQHLIVGQAAVRSDITWEECLIDFAVLHFGDYNVSGGVRHHTTDKAYEAMHRDLKSVFVQNHLPAALQKMNGHFGPHHYSLWDLFKNEQSKVLNQIFDSTLESIEGHFRQIYEHYYPLMRIRQDIRIPLPKALAMTVEFILNRDFIETLQSEEIDIEKLERLAKEIRRWAFTRDKETLAYVASKRMDGLMEAFSRDPQDVLSLKTMCALLRILRLLSLPLDLWKTQNIYFSIAKDIYHRMHESAAAGDKKAKQWVTKFNNLGKYLKVKIKSS